MTKNNIKNILSQHVVASVVILGSTCVSIDKIDTLVYTDTSIELNLQHAKVTLNLNILTDAHCTATPNFRELHLNYPHSTVVIHLERI